jgi:uncharacterized protein YjbJ (UPF0337 family)
MPLALARPISSARSAEDNSNRIADVNPSRWEAAMDKNRIAGVVQQVKGAAKSAVGRVIGSAKLQAEGKADQVAGKAQKALGKLKDAMR